MAAKKKPKYCVLPHRGHAGAIRKDRWNVCLKVSREVILGPYHSKGIAEIVAATLNEAENK